MKYKTIFHNQPDYPDDSIKYAANYINRVVFSLDSVSNDKKEYFVAGGAVRDLISGTKPKDFDLFFENEIERLRVIDTLKHKHKAAVMRETDNAMTLQIYAGNNVFKFDCIKKIYGTVQEVLDGFDFTVCCAAIAPGAFHYHKNFFQHCLSKTLYFNKQQNDICVIRRIIKYVKKGYYIDATQLVTAIKGIKDAPISEEIITKFITTGEDYKALPEHPHKTKEYDPSW